MVLSVGLSGIMSAGSYKLSDPHSISEMTGFNVYDEVSSSQINSGCLHMRLQYL